jgi:hypothetical protein
MATETTTETVPIHAKDESKSRTHQTQWLKTSGVLDQYESFDVTPVIGREFPKASIKEWLEAPNSDELLRDLAITISERGVVYFRKQVNAPDQCTSTAYANSNNRMD